MILAEEKSDAGIVSSSSQSPPYAPSFSTQSPAASSLRPPPPWPASASDTALPLSPPPLAPHCARAHSQSAVYLPAVPSSLTRPVAFKLPRTPFAPMFLMAEGNSLKRGFPVVLPPSPQVPHPFELYDVNETDWTQFLDEMRSAARLTHKDRSYAYAVPILSAIPLVNVAVAEAIKHHFLSKKPALVSLLVDKWNHHFFHPRSIEVILMRGQRRLSGQSDTPVAGLYTPRTVKFAAPPLALRPEPSGDGSKKNKNKDKGKDKDRDKHKDEDRDKTYRLFIVSMEA
ncbi:hypothetical protein GGX14DRAFT_443665 [Mycena pura]|uniref:Uncharacterized protein n=1 Tax=Mycena pura TaxID=153505 RepID=A0AAD6VSI0_9AGAR|nr:hypothetical protein GGX14DRAFT_443665 [Mycena pura]